MLQSIRDGLNSQKWLTYLVLGLLGLVFVAWGAYGIVSFGVGETSYAAEAGGQKITAEEARNGWIRLQEQARGADIPPELKASLQDQILERLIKTSLVGERTQKLGYRVPDEVLLQQIRSIPDFQVLGEYSPEAAKSVLAQNGITLEKYEEGLRSDMRIRQLSTGIVTSDFVTPVEADRARALQDQQREVRYAVLSPDKFQPPAPDDAAVEAYYKAHQAQFMVPETAKVQYAELRLEELAPQMTVSDADLRTAYDKQKAHFVVPERRHAHHILIPVDQAHPDAAALKQAQDVLAQAKAGKDFGQLAKQYSADTESAEKGGDLGFQEKSTFVGPFADALFSMKPGDISGPVKSEFGYHIIRLDEIQADKSQSLDEVKPQLEAQLKKDKATDKFGDLQEQLQSKVEQPGADLAAIAKEMNLQTGEVARYERGTGGDPLGSAPELQSLIFGDQALQAGRLGGPVVVGDDRLVLLKVLDRHKSEPKPLADVRADIVKTLTKERATEAAYKAAESARAKLASGASFDEVVKELNVNADPARFISRTDAGILPELRQAAFDAPKPAGKPSYQTVKLDTGGAAVVAVSQVRSAPQGDKEAQARSLEQAAQRDGSEEFNAYVDQMRAKATVRKNPKVFE